MAGVQTSEVNASARRSDHPGGQVGRPFQAVPSSRSRLAGVVSKSTGVRRPSGAVLGGCESRGDGQECPSYSSRFPLSSDTTTSVRNPSGIVTIPGWLNGTSGITVLGIP